MAGQEQQRRSERQDDTPDTPDVPETTPSAQVRDDAKEQQVDDLLAEIDNVLETNAQEFVHSFVQKGGQ